MKNRVNKQIIKALSVGLAASMALQPVTVFAEDAPASAPAEKSEEASVPAVVVEPQDIDGGIADAAQEAADVVSHEAPAAEAPAAEAEAPAAEAEAPAAEAEAPAEAVDKGGDLQVAAADIDKVTDDIADTAVAGEAGIVDVLKNGKPTYHWVPTSPHTGYWEKNTKDLSQTVIDDADNLAMDTNIADATTDIDNVKKDLIIAENADDKENESVQDAADAVYEIETKTEEVEKKVNAAVKQAEDLADNIKNASSIDDANKSYDDLDKLVEDTKDSVESYNKALYGEDGNGGLMKDYADAQEKLAKYKGIYKEAIEGKDGVEGDGASKAAQVAYDKVEDAEETVKDLEKAIAEAKKNIDKVNAGAIKIAEIQEELAELEKAEEKDTAAIAAKQGELLETVIKSSYADGLIEGAGEVVGVKKVMDGNFLVFYKDERGVMQSPKWFSYDTTDGQFLIYERTSEELTAEAYRLEYKATYPHVAEDKLEVYSYDDPIWGRLYYTLDELEWYANHGQLTEAYDEENNVHYYVFGEHDGQERVIVTPVNAPRSKNGIAVGKSVTDKVISNKSTVYVVKDGKLYRQVVGTVTENSYTRVNEVKTDYRETRYTKAERDEIIRQLEGQLGKDKVMFVEASNTEKQSEIYYQLTGSYVPLYKITINDGEIEEYVGGWFNKEENAKAAFIKRLEDAGYVVTSSNLGTTYKKDSLLEQNIGKEEFYVWGKVDFEKKKAIVIKNTEKYSTYAEAYAALQKQIGNDSVTIKTVDHVEYWVPYEKDVTFNSTSHTELQVTDGQNGKQDTLYAVCVDYLKKELKSTNNNVVISEQAYKNTVEMLSVLEEFSKKDKGLDTNSKEFKQLIADAKNLIAKYERYASETNDVKEDLKQAKDDIRTLQGAINDLDTAHTEKTAGEILALNVDFADYFKVTDDIIKDYFGDESWDELDEEELAEIIDKNKSELKDMKVDEFMDFLDYLKDKAEEKKADIENLLDELIDKRDKSAEDLKDTIERLTPPSSGDDDDTTTGGGGDETTPFIPVAVTPATNVVAPAVDNAQAPAVLGARTTRRSAAKAAADTETVATDNSNGNNDNAAVAGAQKEETKTPEAPKEETKIEDTETALAATPELEEKGFAWWWLLILAAIAGVSVEEYARRKSNKAKAEAKDSTKINK